MRPLLSLIIPTLNEGATLGLTLRAVSQLPDPIEVVVVDGGSTDETVAVAAAYGVRCLVAARGRGAQLHAGACAAQGEAFWFLHADTIPPVDGVAQIWSALADPAVAGGNFTITFDGNRRAARFLTWLYPQLRRLGLCYGDSAIFVRRAAYARTGGFQAFPIFEDLDFIRRLRRVGRIVHLPAAVTTSSRRFERGSFSLTFARWVALQILYWLGVPPRLLGRLYAPIRSIRRKSASKS